VSLNYVKSYLSAQCAILASRTNLVLAIRIGTIGRSELRLSSYCCACNQCAFHGMHLCSACNRHRRTGWWWWVCIIGTDMAQNRPLWSLRLSLLGTVSGACHTRRNYRLMPFILEHHMFTPHNACRTIVWYLQQQISHKWRKTDTVLNSARVYQCTDCKNFHSSDILPAEQPTRSYVPSFESVLSRMLFPLHGTHSPNTSMLNLTLLKTHLFNLAFNVRWHSCFYRLWLLECTYVQYIIGALQMHWMMMMSKQKRSWNTQENCKKRTSTDTYICIWNSANKQIETE